jgi:L-methionine (R)-S-oxide reductase
MSAKQFKRLQKLVGVIDIDCEELEGFNNDDKVGLEAVAKVIIDSCDWW